jgi:hypothetical protein
LAIIDPGRFRCGAAGGILEIISNFTTNPENTMDYSKPISIEAFFGEGIRPHAGWDGQQVMSEADVIIAHDTMTTDEFVVFGTAALEAIVESGEDSELVVLKVEIDQETDDLEKLCGLVMITKGSCDLDTED